MTHASRIRTGGEAYRSLERRARLRLLEMHYAAGVGHIGGNLSALDGMLALHHRVMGSDDVFILSKGHAAGALYITLWTLGLLLDAQLDEFHGEGTQLPGHPAPSGIPAIPLATGSLGHGFPMAAGIALAKRFSSQPGHVFCLTSDGEWEEGSTWEALIFAQHRALENLTVLIDANGLQGFGSTTDVASLDSDLLGDRVAAFGVAVEAVDGHDADAIVAALERKVPGPRLVVLHTVKGKGVSFMEGRMEWHYLPLTEELYAQAVRELAAR
jgi:transketolase